MDIGTAKPSTEEQTRVPHHLIDVVEPNHVFTAADFKTRAKAAITDVQGRGKLPIMVGGTGLYVDAVLYDFQFRAAADPPERKRLEQLSVEELQQQIVAQALPLPRNERNPRHLIRVLETKGQVVTRSPLPPRTLVVGLRVPMGQIKQRIVERIAAMFAQGLEAEVKSLVDRYGWGAEALKAIGYREFEPYFGGHQSVEQVQQQIIRDTIAYAKRQRTWFKRNADITWYETSEQSFEAISAWLSKN
jgi:tRNA dimethylallyltransferase